MGKEKKREMNEIAELRETPAQANDVLASAIICLFGRF